VLILDMGEPVRIADIARRLAAQSAHQVDIVYTGLRPGEKLAEDLLSDDETDHRPCHPLIRHAQVKPLDPAELSDLVPGIGAEALRSRLAGYALAGPSVLPVPSVSPVTPVPPQRLAPTGTAAR
jgi:FlaA1/EpsC-like NDP-sugar epimerase